MPEVLQRGMKPVVHRLLKVSPPRFALLFLIVAVPVSVIIVLAIVFLWDSRFNAELEFAGVLTPFLDGLLLVVFVTAMLNQIREEATRRKQADGNDAVAMHIRDSRMGIEPEHLPELFQPLFTTKTRRVGLGLVMVKNLTEANGGSVAVKSKRGNGTVLTVRLPCVIPEKITTT